MADDNRIEVAGQQLSWKQGCFTVVALGAVLFGIVFGCASFVGGAMDKAQRVEAAKSPQTLTDVIKSASSAVQGVEVYEAQVMVDIYEEPASATDFIRVAAQDVVRVAKAIKANPNLLPATTQTVTFALKAPLVDRLGNESREKIMSFGLRASDLKAANYDNLGDARVLDLAFEGGVSGGAGARALDAWCDPLKGSGSGGNFCEVMGSR